MELIEAERMAAIGEMATTIAHEVRNPLSGIAVAMENLKKRVTTDEKREMINEIISEINRLDRIIIELFQLAMPREIKLVEGDPNELVEKVVELTMPQIKSKSITIEKNLALPSRTISLDYEQLHQVFVNLLLNSIYAIEGNDGKITITTKYENNDLIFEITDTGHGIEKGDLQKIFEPFFSTKEGGSGLGLPISLRIIQAHNGTITVNSVHKEGCVFTVRLPVDLTENSVNKT
jgi:signal transduction histidine kinase